MARLVKCGCGQVLACVVDQIGVRGTCPWCGVSLEVKDANSRAVPELSDGVPPMLVQAAPVPTQTRCARCGREFRGDWDRNPTTEGMLCHICKNQWRPPQQTGGPVPAPELAGDWNPAPLAVLEAEAPRETDDGFQAQRRGRRAQMRSVFWEKWRGKVILAAAAAVTLLVVLVLPVDQYMAILFGGSSMPGKHSAATKFVGYAGWVLFFLSPFIRQYVSLFFGLKFVDSLPFDTLRYNLLSVGVASLVLSLLKPLWFLPLWFILCPLLRFAIIFWAYDLEVKDLFMFFVVYMLAGTLAGFAFKVLMVPFI